MRIFKLACWTEIYLLFQTVKQDDQKSREEKSSSQQRLSKDTHEVLAGIFKKIGSKDHTQEVNINTQDHMFPLIKIGSLIMKTMIFVYPQGLRLLYEFKEQHSESSIEPFLQKSTQFFQDYIQRGLERIELERRRQAGHPEASSRPGTGTAPSISSANTTAMDNASSISESGDVQDANYYLKRLRTLQQSAGFDDVTNAATPPLRNELHLDLEAQLGLDQNLNINSVTENSTEVLMVIDTENISLLSYAGSIYC